MAEEQGRTSEGSPGVQKPTQNKNSGTWIAYTMYQYTVHHILQLQLASHASMILWFPLQDGNLLKEGMNNTPEG